MKKHFLALGLLAAVTVPASAEGLYIFGDVGQSKFIGKDGGTDTALDLGLGYSFNNTFSIELGRHDLGSLGISDYEQGITIKGSIDAKATQLSFIAKAPLSEAWDLYGRLGYARITLDGRASGTFQGQTSPTFSSSESTNKATYGLGLSYKLNNKISLRSEYTKFNDADLSSLTVGAAYAF